MVITFIICWSREGNGRRNTIKGCLLAKSKLMIINFFFACNWAYYTDLRRQWTNAYYSWNWNPLQGSSIVPPVFSGVAAVSAPASVEKCIGKHCSPSIVSSWTTSFTWNKKNCVIRHLEWDGWVYLYFVLLINCLIPVIPWISLAVLCWTVCCKPWWSPYGWLASVSAA